jgi:hypothetical protein
MRPETHTQGVNSLQQGLAVSLHLGSIEDHRRHGHFLDVFADVELSQFVDMRDRPLRHSHDELFSGKFLDGRLIYQVSREHTGRCGI